jgi:uroporphyrinogen decarboxylase
MKGRCEQIAAFKALAVDRYLVCGWTEGLVAEYCDLRGMNDAFLDFYDCPDVVKKATSVILESAKRFITEQIKAGAHCIGVGDAACSQIGNDLYQEFAFQGEKELVEHIHSLGALAKLHICGDTSALMPGMIATGADIVDVDHQVKDIARFVPLLSSAQIFCGNLDPVSVIQNGNPDSIRAAGLELIKNCQGRIIISGGCEITPDTPHENILALASF